MELSNKVNGTSARHSSTDTISTSMKVFSVASRDSVWDFLCLALAAANAAVLPPDDPDWIKPSELLAILDNHRFAKKH